MADREQAKSSNVYFFPSIFRMLFLISDLIVPYSVQSIVFNNNLLNQTSKFHFNIRALNFFIFRSLQEEVRHIALN